MRVRPFEEILNICHDIYMQMYREVEPPADFDFLIKTYQDTEKKDTWRHDYYLRKSRQWGIIDTHCRVNRCNTAEFNFVRQLVMNGLAPSTSESKIKTLEELDNGTTHERV